MEAFMLARVIEDNPELALRLLTAALEFGKGPDDMGFSEKDCLKILRKNEVSETARVTSAVMLGSVKGTSWSKALKTLMGDIDEEDRSSRLPSLIDLIGEHSSKKDMMKIARMISDGMVGRMDNYLLSVMGMEIPEMIDLPNVAEILGRERAVTVDMISSAQKKNGLMTRVVSALSSYEVENIYDLAYEDIKRTKEVVPEIIQRVVGLGNINNRFLAKIMAREDWESLKSVKGCSVELSEEDTLLFIPSPEEMTGIDTLELPDIPDDGIEMPVGEFIHALSLLTETLAEKSIDPFAKGFPEREVLEAADARLGRAIEIVGEVGDMKMGEALATCVKSHADLDPGAEKAALEALGLIKQLRETDGHHAQRAPRRL